MTRELIRAIAGEHIKIRDVNCRYMSGTYDGGDFLNPPHEWHRDSPGEFCIAIPLNEVAEGDNGATAVVPGSHRYPWCPRWNAMFGAPFYISRNPATPRSLHPDTAQSRSIACSIAVTPRDIPAPIASRAISTSSSTTPGTAASPTGTAPGR